MPVLAFDMTTANYRSRLTEFRGRNNADYYDGELLPLSSSDIDMSIEKSRAGDYGIYKLTSRSALAFRRSWSHIRRDHTDLTILWFVRRGRMTVAHSGKRYTVGAHECAITRSCTAFYMELMPDADGVLEVMHVVAPSYRLYSFLAENVEMGRAFSASRGDMYVAERIVSLLFEAEQEIDPETAGHLVETLLRGFGRSVERIVGVPAPPPTIADRRIDDITACIDRNFPRIDLNARMVAESCGISVRYLCHVLKKHDLSFSRLVWDRRMAAADSWLADEKMRHNSISMIAYLSGFKSSAHFSRMFKLRHGMAPREFRQQRLSVH